MASLPVERFHITYSFAVTRIDFAGPIKVTSSRDRGITSTKGYICIFVCFASRAVHVEIVLDLPTKKFLAAFDRFYNRRNMPQSIHSDNGRPFRVPSERHASFSRKTRHRFERWNSISITWESPGNFPLLVDPILSDCERQQWSFSSTTTDEC